MPFTFFDFWSHFSGPPYTYLVIFPKGGQKALLSYNTNCTAAFCQCSCDFSFLIHHLFCPSVGMMGNFCGIQFWVCFENLAKISVLCMYCAPALQELPQ